MKPFLIFLLNTKYFFKNISKLSFAILKKVFLDCMLLCLFEKLKFQIKNRRGRKHRIMVFKYFKILNFYIMEKMYRVISVLGKDRIIKKWRLNYFGCQLKLFWNEHLFLFKVLNFVFCFQNTYF